MTELESSERDECPEVELGCGGGRWGAVRETTILVDCSLQGRLSDSAIQAGWFCLSVCLSVSLSLSLSLCLSTVSRPAKAAPARAASRGARPRAAPSPSLSISPSSLSNLLLSSFLLLSPSSSLSPSPARSSSAPLPRAAVRGAVGSSCVAQRCSTRHQAFSPHHLSIPPCNSTTCSSNRRRCPRFAADGSFFSAVLPHLTSALPSLSSASPLRPPVPHRKAEIIPPTHLGT